MGLGQSPRLWVAWPGVPKLIQDKEIWLSRGEIDGLLQGSLTWADVCSRTDRPARFPESLVKGEGAYGEDFLLHSAKEINEANKFDEVNEGKVVNSVDKPSDIRVTGFLAITALLTLVLWVYFVFSA